MSHRTTTQPSRADEGPFGTRGIVADDRHLVAAKEPGDIFRAALFASRMPMILTDPNQPDNPISFANTAFARLTGYELDEIVGRNCRFLQGEETDPRDIKYVRDGIDNKISFVREVVNYRKDGTKFYNSLFISPIYDDKSDQLMYYFASQFDVTYIHEAAERARVANHLEALGEVTAGVIHDLGNVLQVAVGFAERLQALVAACKSGMPLDIEKAERAAQNVVGSTSRATELLNRLNDFSRNQHHSAARMDVNEMISTFVNDLVSRVVRKTDGGSLVDYHLDLDQETLHACIDRGQFEMALLNLIINSRDAMPNGGKITISTFAEDVTKEQTAALNDIDPGRYTCVRVSDEGQGIPQDIINKVLEPFFTTKPLGRGTGQGLPVVLRFAESYRGTVTIETEVNVGTNITMYFPFDPDQMAARAKIMEDAAE